MTRTRSMTLALALSASVVFTLACTKGMHLGGTEENPAAIDTGGVPDLPKEGEVSEHAAETHAAVAPASGPAKFDIGLTEYKILIENQPASGAVMKAGAFVFHVTNRGTEDHGLKLEGAGQSAGVTGLKPGESRDLPVNLHPGAYTFYCPVTGHKDEGMSLPFTVTP